MVNTMTGNSNIIHISSQRNLCIDNDIFYWSGDCDCAEFDIGAIAVCSPQEGFMSCNRDESYKAIAAYCQENIFSKLNKRLWLFIRTDWTYPTRVKSYQKLWKTPRYRDVFDLDAGKYYDEVEIHNDNLVCFAGIVEIKANCFFEAINMLHNCNSFGLLSEADEKITQQYITDLFCCAYDNHDSALQINWQNLTQLLCPQGAIVLRLAPFIDFPIEHAYDRELDFFMNHQNYDSVILSSRYP